MKKKTSSTIFIMDRQKRNVLKICILLLVQYFAVFFYLVSKNKYIIKEIIINY